MARIMNSMNALWGERERDEDTAAAQEDMSLVVVLEAHIISISLSISSRPHLFGLGVSYSFANTPLIAAQAPLAAASGFQGIFVLVVGLG